MGEMQDGRVLANTARLVHVGRLVNERAFGALVLEKGFKRSQHCCTSVLMPSHCSDPIIPDFCFDSNYTDGGFRVVPDYSAVSVSAVSAQSLMRRPFQALRGHDPFGKMPCFERFSRELLSFLNGQAIPDKCLFLFG
jgi:hypothetical protein